MIQIEITEAFTRSFARFSAAIQEKAEAKTKKKSIVEIPNAGVILLRRFSYYLFPTHRTCDAFRRGNVW